MNYENLPEIFTNYENLPQDAVVLMYKGKIAVHTKIDATVYDASTGQEVPYVENDKNIIYNTEDAFLLQALDVAVDKIAEMNALKA